MQSKQNLNFQLIFFLFKTKKNQTHPESNSYKIKKNYKKKNIQSKVSLKYGCSKASIAEIRFFGFTSNSFCNKS